MRPVMKNIGATLLESTKRRFETGTGPDGQRWESLAQNTLLARLAEASRAYAKYSNIQTREEGTVYVGKKKGYFRKKDGLITKRSGNKIMSMKPLIETKELSTTLRYQIINGGTGVEIGTNRTFKRGFGAEVHQFGTRDGHIPARPFLGLSTSDRTSILSILSRALSEKIP
jgi:phage gpG-like protein